MSNDFYDVIFKRKSVRKYDLKPLDNKILNELQEFIGKLEPLIEGIKIETRIAAEGEAGGLLSVKAPHYLIMTSEEKDGYLTNAGYIFQQVDLFLSSRGIGTCYLGLTQPNKDIKKDLTHEVVMVLAFGNPAESVHRTSALEFKRKPLEEITSVRNFDELIEPVRLAPSATNSQPWYLTGENGSFNVYCVKPNFIKALVYEKLNKFDVGIGIYHFAAAARHFNKDFEFVKEKTAEKNPPKGYYYIGTLDLKK